MSTSDDELCVFYDGACPSCVKDRQRYERLAGRAGASVQWVDITGRDRELETLGINPRAALQELHVRDRHGKVHREMDAYILLMSRAGPLRPLGWLIGLPVVRPALSKLYHAWVSRRLRKTGRYPD